LPCRTGFYLSIWGEVSSDTIKEALLKSLDRVGSTEIDEVPGLSAKECGNFRDHSLFSAKEYAKKILEGFKSS